MNTQRIIRVFPRRTSATPTDELAIVDRLPEFWDEADEIRVSVAFTEDKRKAEHLAREWEAVAPVEVGGPAYNDPGGSFVPGMYLRDGYTITSRGCPNQCWFCQAWRNEGNIRTLPIVPGWNVLDNNVLACPDAHVAAVFDMLEKQSERIRFTGGLEAERLQPWHVQRIAEMRTDTLWLAYDMPDDYEPLRVASKMLQDAGILRPHARKVGCYVLCGYNRAGHVDTLDAAERRMVAVAELGIMPQAMLYERGTQWRHESDRKKWSAFAREWANRVIVESKMQAMG